MRNVLRNIIFIVFLIFVAVTLLMFIFVDFSFKKLILLLCIALAVFTLLKFPVLKNLEIRNQGSFYYASQGWR